MSFTNVYYKRKAGTERSCFVCYKPTTTVLATVNTVDFVYTCDDHLKDRGFASPIETEEKKPSVSAEEIAKAKEEWEEKQRAKKEREKEKKAEKSKDKDGDKDNNGKKDEEKKEKDGGKAKTGSSGSSPASPSSPPPQQHQKYALHRDFYAMRQAEHRKKRNAAQAKELAPRLPGAPRGTISG